MVALVLIIGVLIAILFFVKLTNKGQNVWSYLIVAGMIFLVVTLLYATTLPGVSLMSFEGFVDFSKIYFSWLGKLFGNVATITGRALELDWRVGLNETG